jgi:apolipoprotein N-acyltransferase
MRRTATLMSVTDNNMPFSITKSWRALSTTQVLLAILSGLLLTASFPPGKLSFLVWPALVPLLKSLDNESPSQAFRLGFLTGLSHYLTLIYWIMVVLGHYGNMSTWVSLGPFLLLSLYLALYPAIFSSITAYLRGSRFTLTLTAGFWVSLEYVRAHVITGFPWCLLGYTQYEQSYLIQIADLCGVYGLSFLIVIVNGLLFTLFFKNHARSNAFFKWEILFTALIVIGTLAYSHYRLFEEPIREQPRQYVGTLIVQGNIDQSIKWDPAYQAETMATYQRLTRTGYSFNPDLIVWPETSAPFFFQDNAEFSPMIFSVVKESQAALIFGSPAYELVGRMINYYNRAYLITPDNLFPQHYDKVHLVPFGEYIPLKKLLSFLHRLVPAAGDFVSGDKIAPLKYKGLSIGILICFEAIFPELARAQTRGGADILVNLTNDAWFGMTSAPYQHLAMVVFRAVENRRPMIRAANTGFSAYIEPKGKIVALSSLFREEVLEASVNISDRPLTVYTRFGDIFAFFLLVICLLKILSLLWHKKGVG